MSDIQNYYWKHEGRQSVLVAIQAAMMITSPRTQSWNDGSYMLEAAFSDPDWVEISEAEAAQLAKSYGTPWPPPLPT